MANDEQDRQAREDQLRMLTSTFCKEYLDDEYEGFCNKLINMMMKRGGPFLIGRPKAWAAAIIYAIGDVNHLFSGPQPAVEKKSLCHYFAVFQSTLRRRVDVLREAFHIGVYAPVFVTRHTRETQILARLAWIDGRFVPLEPET